MTMSFVHGPLAHGTLGVFRHPRIQSRVGRTKGTPLSDDFTVKPGETLDLGDIVIEKPNP